MIEEFKDTPKSELKRIHGDIKDLQYGLNVTESLLEIKVEDIKLLREAAQKLVNKIDGIIGRME